jgi:peptide/nickel transport system permease protein
MERKNGSVSAYDQESLEITRKSLVRAQRRLQIRKFTKNKSSVIGLSLITICVLIAVFAPQIAGKSPYTADVVNRLKPPSREHLFGTDTIGRDLFSRVIYGARVSMIVGFSVSVISGVLGMIIGLYASFNKHLDTVLMRVCDGLKAIPATLLAIMLMAVMGADIGNVIISLVIVSIPSMAIMSRSTALVIREQTYIEAMRCLGAGSNRIIWKHIAPNIVSSIIVQITFFFASSIITEAALSFLGAGVPAPIPSWGSILNEGKNVIFNAWWMTVFPGIFTALAVLGLNLFGDGLRDILDPMTN